MTTLPPARALHPLDRAFRLLALIFLGLAPWAWFASVAYAGITAP